jgi:uncharacterized membrane protein
MNQRMGVALLSVAGLLISAYLWMFKHGYIGTLACGTGGCETVQLSPYSSFLGVDVALIGFLGYVVFLAVSLVGVQPAWLDRPGPSRLLVLLAVGGLVFAGYLTGLEFFVIHAICRWCAASAVIVLLIFVLALLDHRRFARR